MVVIVREEQPSLLLVADKAIDLLQKVPALHGDTHVGNGRIHLFTVLFGVFQGLLDRLLFKVQLQRDAVTISKDLIPCSASRPMSGVVSGRLEMAAVTSPCCQNGQPGAHAVRYLLMNRVLTLWFSSLSMTS